jgi:hypothetical protein
MEAWARPVGNLSPAAASKKLRTGVMMLGIGLAGAVTMAKLDAPLVLRLLLLVPFFLAANGFFQSVYRA